MTTRQRDLLLDVQLEEIVPPIRRRLRVRDYLPLADLHVVLQTAMGWQDCHLYEFHIAGRSYADLDQLDEFEPDGIAGVLSVRLSDLALEPGDELLYVYDLGDDWRHRIRVEEVMQREARVPPAVCVEGERRCPPEDCGGVDGYADMLAALRDPQDPEHELWRAWVGSDYDPERFSVEEVNAALAALFKPGGRAVGARQPVGVVGMVEDAIALMEAVAQSDDRISGTVLKCAADLLRAQARAKPGHLTPFQKLEGWAAGSLHAAFLVTPRSAGVRRMTLKELAQRFGITASTVGQRSHDVRFTLKQQSSSKASGSKVSGVAGLASRAPAGFREVREPVGASGEDAGPSDAEGAPWRVAEELLLAAQGVPAAAAEALYLRAADLLAARADAIEDDELRRLIRLGLETRSDETFTRFLALGLREFGAEAATWVPPGSGRRRGRRARRESEAEPTDSDPELPLL